MIAISTYDSKYKEAFKTLNLAWINKYFKVEEEDNRVLNDPEKYILAHGGQLFFALKENQVVGTCALIKIDDKEFELAKMAVDEAFQGQGLGKILAESALEYARKEGAEMITLVSNRILIPALRLYEAFGFEEVAFAEGEQIYERGNIKMKKIL